PAPHLPALGSLDFADPDTGRFPALRLARDALEAGGSAPIVLNAANEVAVASFLAGAIRFTDIALVVEPALAGDGGPAPSSIGEVVEIDRNTRERVRDMVKAVCT